MNFTQRNLPSIRKIFKGNCIQSISSRTSDYKSMYLTVLEDGFCKEYILFSAEGSVSYFISKPSDYSEVIGKEIKQVYFMRDEKYVSIERPSPNRWDPGYTVSVTLKIVSNDDSIGFLKFVVARSWRRPNIRIVNTYR